MTDEFEKFDQMIDDEYGDDGVDGLYNDAGGRAPNFDCPMEAVLSVERLVKDRSGNPDSETEWFMAATFKIEKFIDKKPPIEGGKSQLREGGQVGDFNRLPDPNYDLESAHWKEKNGLSAMYQMIASILGLQKSEINGKLIGQCFENDGQALKGKTVGVIVNGREWEADDGSSGVQYDQVEYYPVHRVGDDQFEKVEPVPLSELDL